MNKIICWLSMACICHANAQTINNYAQNASGLGLAYAGTGVVAEDASVGFYNPAGISFLTENQISFALLPSSKVSKLEVNSAQDSNGIALGSANTKSRVSSIFPTAHFYRRLSPKWSLGMQYTSPYAIKNQYQLDSIVRFVSTKTELISHNVSPTIAYQASDRLSLGLSFNILHTNLETSSQYAATGSQFNDLDGVGFGGNLGLIYAPSDDMKLGFSYKTGVRVKAKGTSTSTNVGAIATKRNAESILKLPQIFNYGISQVLNDKWEMMADLEWVRLKSMDGIKITFSDGTTLQQSNFTKDSYRIALGSKYKFKSNLAYKLGIAFDKSATTNNTRSITLLDSDKLWLALGMKYSINKMLNIDAGFAHIIYKKSGLDESVITSDKNPDLYRINATARKFSDKMGIQLTWNFV